MISIDLITVVCHKNVQSSNMTDEETGLTLGS